MMTFSLNHETGFILKAYESTVVDPQALFFRELYCWELTAKDFSQYFSFSTAIGMIFSDCERFFFLFL